MFCFIRSYEFFLVLATPGLVGLALVVVFIVRANIEEGGGPMSAVKSSPTVGVNKLFEVHGFFSERGYFNARARLFLRRARWSWWIAIIFFAIIFGVAGLIVFGDICRAD